MDGWNKTYNQQPVQMSSFRQFGIVMKYRVGFDGSLFSLLVNNSYTKWSVLCVEYSGYQPKACWLNSLKIPILSHSKESTLFESKFGAKRLGSVWLLSFLYGVKVQYFSFAQTFSRSWTPRGGKCLNNALVLCDFIIGHVIFHSILTWYQSVKFTSG